MNSFEQRQPLGFTLIELLVALAIIAILSALVFPSYNNYQLRSYRTQALTDLAACALNAERQRSNTFTYVGIHAAGVPIAAVCNQFSPNDATTAADAKYRISVTTATATAYTLLATPLNGQDGNGKIELDANGAKRWDKDNSNTFGASENTWQE